MTHDEHRQIHQFRAGDAGSFEHLYQEYGTRIYRFSLRLCGNATQAEDLTQEVFLAAFQSAERFEGRSSLATWLYRIALYRWRSLYKSHRPETVAWEEVHSPVTSDLAQRELERISLESALASLGEPLREAFLLVKGEGFLCREAAEILGIPEGTLKSRVYSAITQLQRLLQPEENLPSEQKPLLVRSTEKILR